MVGLEKPFCRKVQNLTTIAELNAFASKVLLHLYSEISAGAGCRSKKTQPGR
jgi:hypothetical protein